MIGLICLKELMLMKPMVRTSVLFASTGTLWIWILDFNQKHVMVVMIYCKRLLVMMLQLFLLKEIIIEFIFGTWVKMMLKIQWEIVIYCYVSMNFINITLWFFFCLSIRKGSILIKKAKKDCKNKHESLPWARWKRKSKRIFWK